METFNDLQFTTKSKAKKDTRISYLGAVLSSAKMRLSYANGTMTYCLYLAPADLSGYNVCPNSKYCKDVCLNGSGRNLMDILHTKTEYSTITKARIKKTKLFFENKPYFMQWLITEIKKAKQKAFNENMNFSVRLNGTSDIDITEFNYNGQNILEIFPDIQFYDYTKVPQRMKLAELYPNYDLTFSFNGYNWATCEKLLNNNHKVAVVFEEKLPRLYKGYKVNNGNTYDMRYLDNGGEIVGLKYHKVANNYSNGKYNRPNTKFVVKTEDTNRINY